jgi:ribose transport system substrate-binding protein
MRIGNLAAYYGHFGTLLVITGRFRTLVFAEARRRQNNRGTTFIVASHGVNEALTIEEDRVQARLFSRNISRRTFAAGTAAALSAALLPITARADDLKMAFVTNNASEFWKIASAGVHKYEQEAGVKVDIFLPTNGTVEEQNRILDDLMSQGYGAIAISVIAPRAQVSIVNRAAEKAKVICFDSDAAKSKRLAYIGTDNFVAGQTLGQEIVKLLPQGGDMAVFVGTLSADNAAQRLSGVQDAIKDHNIKIVAKKEDETDRNKARTNVENVLNADSDVKLVCGLWSYNGPAIAKALNASGKKGQVLAAVFDEEDGTLAGIADGTISVTVVQKPYKFGYLSSKLMHELLTKGDSALPEGGKIDTGVTVINKDNVADFKAELMKLKS